MGNGKSGPSASGNQKYRPTASDNVQTSFDYTVSQAWPDENSRRKLKYRFPSLTSDKT